MRLAAGLVALVCGVAAAPATGQVKLEWQFKEGDKFFVESAVTEKQSFEVMGKTQNGDLMQRKVWSFTVRKAGEPLVLEQRLEKWELKGNALIGRLPPKVPERLKGAIFTVTLTPNGNITQFEGYSAALKRLDAESDLMAKLWRPILREDVFRHETEGLFRILPEKQVSPGDTWTRATNLPLPPFGGFRVEHHFTYKGKEKQGERIEDKAALTFELPKGDVGGLPIKVTKGEFLTEGINRTLEFDAARGRLVRMQAHWSFRGVLNLESDGNQAQIRLEVHHSETARVLDKLP
jgi:hypothetical protein